MTRNVVKIHLGESYNPSAKSAEGDAAILKLDRPLEFNNFVTPICLPPANASVYEIVGTVVGYGKSPNVEIHEILPNKVSIESVTQEECVRSDQAFVTSTSENTFCAGGKDGKSPCKGF